MSKQDSYVRLSVRLPAEIYAKVKAASGAKSINAEIVARLESSFQAVRINLDGGSLFSAAQVSQLLKAITADMQDIPS